MATVSLSTCPFVVYIIDYKFLYIYAEVYK
jgi:hypothetical protein